MPCHRYQGTICSNAFPPASGAGDVSCHDSATRLDQTHDFLLGLCLFSLLPVMPGKPCRCRPFPFAIAPAQKLVAFAAGVGISAKTDAVTRRTRSNPNATEAASWLRKLSIAYAVY